MKTEDENVNRFIKHVKKVAKEYGIKVCLYNKENIVLSKATDDHCSGFFSDTDKKLVVATKKDMDKWVGVLAHEFGHLMQYVEGAPAWTNLYLEGKDDSCSKFFNWLFDDLELHPELVDYHTNRLVELEFDAEKRSVEFIKEFDLPIDIPEYIQKANSYIWFYSVVKTQKKWCAKNKSPYDLKRVYSLCPDKWVKNPFKPSKKYIESCTKHCFE